MGGTARVGVLLVSLCVVSLICATVARSNHDDVRRWAPLSLPEQDAGLPSWADQRAAFAGRLRRGYGLDQPVADEFAGWILEAAVRQHLAPELLASLVMTESSFRKHARSPIGAVGPAQVRADMWSAFCGGELEDPEQNLYCGAQILAHYREACIRRASDDAESCALRSYNVGFRNRDNGAAARYIAKIDRYRTPLINAAAT